MASRLERTPFAEWWWTIDRLLLAGLMILMLAGIVLGMAGSPPVAERLGLSTFHFVNRQVMYLIPAFVVMAAWAFSEGGRRTDVPGNIIGFLLLFATIIPLVLQPDIGQTMLIVLVWGGLVFLSGLHLFWVLGLGGLGVLGLFAAYTLLPHVAARIDRFMDPASGDTFQIDNAIESFVQGGWLGKGPGEGTVKRILPDSHTDFIFAVTAEEFGIVVCLALAALFMLVVLRGMVLSRRNEEPFGRLAAAGLVMLFGMQSVINMGV